MRTNLCWELPFQFTFCRFNIAQIVVWLARSALARLGVVSLVAVLMNLHKLYCKTSWILFDVGICSLVFCLSLVLSGFLLACLFLFSLAFRVCSFICSRFVLGGFVFVSHWRCFFVCSSYMAFSVALSVFCFSTFVSRLGVLSLCRCACLSVLGACLYVFSALRVPPAETRLTVYRRLSIEYLLNLKSLLLASSLTLHSVLSSSFTSTKV